VRDVIVSLLDHLVSGIQQAVGNSSSTGFETPITNVRARAPALPMMIVITP